MVDDGSPCRSLVGGLTPKERMLGALAGHSPELAKGFVASTGSPFPLDTNPQAIVTLVATAHLAATTLDEQRGERTQ